MKEVSKQDLINYRLAKADEVFQEALDVASMNHWNLAVNRLYYSVFHMASSLLLAAGFTARTDTGIIRLLLKEYVYAGALNEEDGKLISSLFNMRKTGDYDDMYDWEQEKVVPFIQPTRDLIDKIKLLVKTE